jgi:hypothetical protein
VWLASREIKSGAVYRRLQVAKAKTNSASVSITVEKLLLTGREWQQLRDEHPIGFIFMGQVYERHYDLYFVIFKLQVGSDLPRYVPCEITFNLAHYGLEQQEIQHYMPLIDKQFNYIVEYLGEVIAQSAGILITESEVWKWGQFQDKVSQDVWKKELDSLHLSSQYDHPRMKGLQGLWAEKARERLTGFGYAHTGSGSKIKFRLPSGSYSQLQLWYKTLKPICLRVRKAHITHGDVKAAARLFDNKVKTGIPYLDNQELYLDEDLVGALNERKLNRQFIYKPYQVAAVQAARLTSSLSLSKANPISIGMSQWREILRLLSKG